MSTSISFDSAGTFEASRAAEKWLRDRGFSYGPSQHSLKARNDQ